MTLQLRTAIIKDCRKEDIDPDRPISEQKVCLYTHKKPHRLLGRHPNEDAAMKQEKAIQINKRGAANAPPKRIRVSGFVYDIFQEAGDQYILYRNTHIATVSVEDIEDALPENRKALAPIISSSFDIVAENSSSYPLLNKEAEVLGEYISLPEAVEQATTLLYKYHLAAVTVDKAVQYKGARYELVDAASPTGRLGIEDQAALWLGSVNMYLDRYLGALEGEETPAQKSARAQLEKSLAYVDKFTKKLVEDLESCKSRLG